MTTLYEKVGRRYVPVQDTRAYEGLTNGSWLVDVRDGRTMVIRVEDNIEKIAALPALIEVITDELREASRCTLGNTSRPLTSKERKAIKAYRDVMGEDATLSMTRPSSWDIAERVARALIAKAAENQAKP